MINTIEKKGYSYAVKFFALFLYAIEIIFLIWLMVSVFSQKGMRMFGARVVRINKENIVIRPEDELKFYYEWAPNQVLRYDTGWLPNPIVKRTNEDGIIGDKNYLIPKPEDVFRILAIGDSFTEGMYVSLQDTYPVRLESMLNAMSNCPESREYEIINLGVGGYDLEYAAHRFVTKGAKYSPDLVIWLVKDDDFVQRSEVDWSQEQEYFRYVSEDLKGNLKEFPLYKQWADELHEGGGLQELLHQIVVKEQLIVKAHRGYIPYQEKAVDSVIRSAQSPVLMMTYKETNPEFRARMILWEKIKIGMYFFGGIPTLVDEKETFEPNDGHANANGYQKTAAAVYAELRRRGLLCKKK